MPHSLSAKKRLRQNETLRTLNKSKRTAMKTAMKKVLVAVESNDVAAAEKALPGAMSMIDKAAKCNAIHANTAGRRKARLSRAILRIKNA